MQSLITQEFTLGIVSRLCSHTL